MGAAFSLPFLSFFALPIFTSYGTSVNLLFFTLNWYILVLTNPPLKVELLGISVIQLLFYVLPALLFLLFDAAVPSIAAAIKSQGEIALPGRLGRWKVGKIAAWSLFNVALGLALQAGLELFLTKVLHVKTAISISKRMPLPWSIARQVGILVLSKGVLQYYIHRFVLHNPRIILSKYHAAWKHTIPAPFSLCAAYDFPPCYLLHHWLPFFAPAFAIRAHILSVIFALVVTSLESLVTYSGYSILPSGILLPGMARRIDNHFIVQGQGNFAAFGLLDWCHGTSVGRDVVEDMKAEWDKHDGDGKLLEASERAGGLIDGIGDKVKETANGRRRKVSAKA